jgi:uncharacterized protein YecE (DUF72 family)
MADNSSRPDALRIGTSGYSFADWVGPFYPERIEKGKMLDFYVRHFDTVEINSTYYRIPHGAVFYHIERKTPANFEFIVKAHRSFTHDRQNYVDAAQQLMESLDPLVRSGKLKGILAQFPWSFKCSPSHLEYVRSGTDLFAGFPLFVEFRHNSWLRDEVFAGLQEAGIGYSCVDEPQLRGMLAPGTQVTTDTGYVRLHGRNAEKWWSGGGERYDYSYTDQQLREWVDRIDSMRQKAGKVFVFFNNCHQGQAVRDAKRFIELLNIG